LTAWTIAQPKQSPNCQIEKTDFQKITIALAFDQNELKSRQVMFFLLFEGCKSRTKL